MQPRSDQLSTGHRIMKIIPAILLLVIGSASVSALTINLHYVPPGQQLGTFGIADEAPRTNQGGGDFAIIMRMAAAIWESAIQDEHTLDIDYGWFLRSGSTTASHRLVSEGGIPHRQTAAAIAFDSDRGWFLDPTPWESSEYPTYNEYTDGGMNVGREYTNGFGAAGNRDLLSTAIHEIGHALGLASANDAFRALAGSNTEGMTRPIVIRSPLPFAGTTVVIDDTTAHLDGAFYQRALLRSSRSDGVRRMPSEVDILVNAEISRFTKVDLNPKPDPECSIAANTDGSVTVEFIGILRVSDSLTSWSTLMPQPSSPYTFMPVGSEFYRSEF